MSKIESELGLIEENFPVHIIKKGEKYFVRCDKFKLITEGASLNEAYDKLSTKRAQCLEQLNAVGIHAEEYLDLKSIPPQQNKMNNKKNSMKNIAYFLVIFFIVFSVGITLTGKLVTNKVVNFASNIEDKVLFKIKSKINNPSQLSAAAIKLSTMLERVTPEKKEELLIAFKKTLLFMKPFFDEVSKTLSDEKLNKVLKN